MEKFMQIVNVSYNQLTLGDYDEIVLSIVWGGDQSTKRDLAICYSRSLISQKNPIPEDLNFFKNKIGLNIPANPNNLTLQKSDRVISKISNDNEIQARNEIKALFYWTNLPIIQWRRSTL